MRVESRNGLNVSIKDMNKAFKDQVTKIKEKQDTSDQSLAHHQLQGDSLDQIEIGSQVHNDNSYFEMGKGMWER